MIFLRIVSFLAGSFVLLASPFFLLTQRQGIALTGGWALAVGALAVAVFAAAYFFFALFAHKIARSPKMREAGIALLGFQLAASIVVLATSHNTQALIAVAPLLCYSICLFMAFIWPGDSTRSHRPMRRRDNSDHYLSS